ncbi:rhodanese-like domain-containing protein [Rufibacter immobilis]|uniref:rhodanese-like domain-containing protein n=1 Tax=Rufibacter immobilis TaxID=1348778 RepID=UPI0035EA278A
MRLLIAVFALCISQTLAAQDVPALKLSPNQFKTMVKEEKGTVIDVRTLEEFAQGHLKKAVNSDFRGGAFAQNLGNLDKDKTYYLYCATGNRSGQALKLMQEAGFTNVYNLGGYKDLKAAGLKTKAAKTKK